MQNTGAAGAFAPPVYKLKEVLAKIMDASAALAAMFYTAKLNSLRRQPKICFLCHFCFTAHQWIINGIGG